MDRDVEMDLQRETHLGNKINFAQLLALIFQGAVLVWGASALNSAVQNQQKQIDTLAIQMTASTAAQSSLDSKMSKMEGTINYQTKVLDNINDMVMRKK